MSEKKRILVIDDDVAVHGLLREILPCDACSMEAAYDAASALDLLNRGDYDLVIADIRMPDVPAALEAVREHHPNLRVLAITGEGNAEDVIRSLQHRAFSVFSKPLPAGAVADMIEQALRAPDWADDIQVLCARPEWISLRVRCKLDAADRLVQFVREVEGELPTPERDAIAMGFRELLLNAIEHGGKSDPTKFVEVSCVRGVKARIYLIRDPGEGFSFDQLAHAAVGHGGSPVEHVAVRSQLGIRPGGFGLLLTQKIADELIYNDKGNEVLFIKYVNGNGNGSAEH